MVDFSLQLSYNMASIGDRSDCQHQQWSQSCCRKEIRVYVVFVGKQNSVHLIRVSTLNAAS